MLLGLLILATSAVPNPSRRTADRPTMPALDLSLVARSPFLVKRADNWASNNVGVVLVFAIVFIVAAGLISLFIYRRILARQAARQ